MNIHCCCPRHLPGPGEYRSVVMIAALVSTPRSFLNPFRLMLAGAEADQHHQFTAFHFLVSAFLKWGKFTKTLNVRKILYINQNIPK